MSQRLSDFFLPLLLDARRLAQSPDDTLPEFAVLQGELAARLDAALADAVEAGYSDDATGNANFAVGAFLDEIMLVSLWRGRSEWQKRSLQKQRFNTVNSGVEFYERLDALGREPEDLAVREVFFLCLALGFKGKYFRRDDQRRIEEIRTQELAQLLPGDTVRELSELTLFPAAYGSRSRDGMGSFKPRVRLVPWVVGLPVVMILAGLLFFRFRIHSAVADIAALVQW
ncbi:MAG: DotU family type IV/VI secretion system protein [Proteobacteria bacterium]|nr:DotU family type IV/VI secretion system protein [Pseudomonadota bacterium]